MKWLIASDIHGSAYWCRKLIEKYKVHEPKVEIVNVID